MGPVKEGGTQVADFYKGKIRGQFPKSSASPPSAVTPHGVLPRDSHEISPTIGGVHKLMILLRDLVKDNLQRIFGEEMGRGQGDPDPLMF